MLGQTGRWSQGEIERIEIYLIEHLHLSNPCWDWEHIAGSSSNVVTSLFWAALARHPPSAFLRNEDIAISAIEQDTYCKGWKIYPFAG